MLPNVKWNWTTSTFLASTFPWEIKAGRSRTLIIVNELLNKKTKKRKHIYDRVWCHPHKKDAKEVVTMILVTWKRSYARIRRSLRTQIRRHFMLIKLIRICIFSCPLAWSEGNNKRAQSSSSRRPNPIGSSLLLALKQLPHMPNCDAMHRFLFFFWLRIDSFFTMIQKLHWHKQVNNNELKEFLCMSACYFIISCSLYLLIFLRSCYLIF